MDSVEIKNILYTAVIGDALGVPVEMSPRESYQVTEITGGGHWQQQTGSWSDDTSMTLATIDNFNQNGDYKDLMNKFVDYYEHSKYTPDDFVYGVGETCQKAIQNFENGIAPLKCGLDTEMSNGNGALMRLAPLAIILRHEHNLEHRLELTKGFTNLTHRNSKAVLASYIYTELLHYLLRNKSLENALKITEVNLHNNGEWPHFDFIFSDNFKNRSRSEIKSSGYVVDTLSSAIWSVYNSSSIEEAVLTAVNLGNDADTIASITGTISACKYLGQRMPKSYYNALRNKVILNQYIFKFSDKFEDK